MKKFWIVLAILALLVAGIAFMTAAMAVQAGGVMCTFNVPILLTCLKVSSIMLGLRIALPILAVLTLGGLAREFVKRKSGK